MTIQTLAIWRWLLLVSVMGSPVFFELIGIDPVLPEIAQEPSRQLQLAEADRLLLQGQDQYRAREFQAALASLAAALERYHEIGDQSGEADALDSLGYVHFVQGNYTSAIDFYTQHVTVIQALIDAEGPSEPLIRQAAASLSQLGDIYRFLEKFHFSVDSFEQALSIMRDLERRDRLAEAYLLNSQGVSYQKLGQFLRAQKNHEEALEVARTIEAPTVDNQTSESDLEEQIFILESTALGNLAIVYNALGEQSLALSLRREHLDLVIEMGDLVAQAKVFNNLGVDYSQLEQYADALEYFRQALVLAQEVGSGETEIAALNGLGRGYTHLRQYETAFDHFQQALTISQHNHFRGSEVDVLTDMGYLHLFLDDAPNAETVFWQAVPIAESLRDDALPDVFKVSLFDLQSSTYEGLEQALVLQGKDARALEISERKRARAFVDLLSASISEQQTAPLLAAPPDLKAIQRIAQQNQSVLVEYSLVEIGADSPAIYIWVVQPDGQLDFHKVALENDSLDLSSLVMSSRAAIGDRSRGGLELSADYAVNNDHLRQLHQLLIEPIADLLPTDPEQRVVFIPQGELFLVPFPALIDEADTYLIEKHTILTAPSIQVLDLSWQQREAQAFSTVINPQNLLLVGNPAMPEVWNPETSTTQALSNLPGAEQEARAIASFFNTTALLGSAATETAVKDQIGNARIIHLATHGLLEYGNPQDSGVRDVPGAIALTPGDGEDGLLTAAEIIEELDLNAELVVLSACDTGLGQVTGDGVIGLSRSLIAAGAPSVIVSLWSVPDAPTADLMTEFYDQMRQGQDKAQALRQAMLTTMANYPNPRGWAAFTLIGTAD
ncbi:MAG: CHAT domain-containing tetratricopeptide repeat protein [Cyanobacteria bacterium P01_D01_bin.156]